MSLDGALKAALVTVMVKTRDWNPTACKEHLERLEQAGKGASPESFARVVGNYVSAKNEDGTHRYTSPAILAEPGVHWDKTEVARRKQRQLCQTHGKPFPCDDCKNDATFITAREARLKDQYRANRELKRKTRKAEQQDRQKGLT